ncbi:hypothetical protein [Nostoc sp.]
MKSQVIVDQANGQIICTAHGKGKSMIFGYLKMVERLRENIECFGDKGYQGIKKMHHDSQIAKKKPRGGGFDYQDKRVIGA